MKRSVRKHRIRSRKCKHCNQLYTPDPRNRWHQKYCEKPQCREASKQASQRKWLLSSNGQGYFCGSVHVARVQAWRKVHPGYWKRIAPKDATALQDVLSLHLSTRQTVTDGLTRHALQDICSVQPALMVGLIASLTGSTLQDEIAETTHRFIVSGRDILGNDPQPPRR